MGMSRLPGEIRQAKRAVRESRVLSYVQVTDSVSDMGGSDARHRVRLAFASASPAKGSIGIAFASASVLISLSKSQGSIVSSSLSCVRPKPWVAGLSGGCRLAPSARSVVNSCWKWLAGGGIAALRDRLERRRLIRDWGWIDGPLKSHLLSLLLLMGSSLKARKRLTHLQPSQECAGHSARRMCGLRDLHQLVRSVCSPMWFGADSDDSGARVSRCHSKCVRGASVASCAFDRASGPFDGIWLSNFHSCLSEWRRFHNAMATRISL